MHSRVGVIPLALVFLVTASLKTDGFAHAQDSTSAEVAALRSQLQPVIAEAQARDSLVRLALEHPGEGARILHEQAWDGHREVQTGLVAAIDQVESRRKRGQDVAPAVAVLVEAARKDWAGLREMLDWYQAEARTLREARDAATGPQRLSLEAQISQRAARIVQLLEDAVNALLGLEGVGAVLTAERSLVIEKLTTAAHQMVAAMDVLKEGRSVAAARAARNSSDATARDELAATDEALRRASRNLSAAIALLTRLRVDTADLKVTLITATGKLTADVLRPPVFIGLLRYAWNRLIDMLATEAPRWFFQALVIVGILVGFQVLGKVVRRVLRRALANAQMSQLLRNAITGVSAQFVMAIGLIMVLRQLGVDLGPLLAGLGIAGFVLGFAMQNTLSNFAAGGLLLIYQPFDIGDDIIAGGANGKVKRMNLVSTTILTGDNQTLIVPNSRIWGDVICNTSAQATRRVDMTFGAGHEQDVVRIEGLLREIVNAHAEVLKEPAPVIRLNQLADSSLSFVVRVWVLKDRYWQVYWDITRAVKTRFDQEGIKIPLPQREVYMNMIPGSVARPA